ncbi:lysine-specific histone demethylase 2-like isoform X2 [Babylonia areolata]|uniref:lysine-specific histone demethylase 2-like isoform X2 n=1 Tax=Babylonia areolata TaxID=304850 RepID=UPI003FD5F35E
MSSTSTRSSRGVKVNKRYRDDDDEGDKYCKLPKRRCERGGCPCDVPICFARVSDRCAGSKWTSRWYHITPAEHFCNECFEYFYRSHKHGHTLFQDWKREWSLHGKSEATLKKFMSDTLVPFWVQCTVPSCRKWRQLSKDVSLKTSFIDKYVCGMSAAGMKKTNQKDACSNPEDERVGYVEQTVWLKQTTVPPYLKDSPAAQMLQGYYPDGVGISATDPLMHSSKRKPTVFPCSEYLSPFVSWDGQRVAYMLMPDMMGRDEIAAFPLVAEYQPYMYLAIRNLVLASWSQNAKWVTREQCERLLICRGLNRACCMFLLDPILAFLTWAGYINVGLVVPPPYLRLHTASQCDVVVVGAGASGLGAAYRLSSFGLKVKILESKHRIGGRVWDEDQDEMCFARGPQLMAGAVNNPIAVLAYQSDMVVQKVGERCQLLQRGGGVVDVATDRRLHFHFNALLDALCQWRTGCSQDVSLLAKFKELHQEFEEETCLKFTEEEERILQFHLSSLEYVGGCSLQQLSAQHWDHSEATPQFGDRHLLLPSGYGPLLHHLAQGLDIDWGAKVTHIDYSGEQTTVKTSSGEMYTADRVLLTVPLAVLKSGQVQFHPPLPDDKIKAITSLGVGKVEKVILQFDQNFWRQKTKGDDLFGIVPSSEATRGLFNLFYTVTCRPNKGGDTFQARTKERYLLVSHVVGPAVDLVQKMTDTEIKDLCLDALRSVFPHKVPEPVRWAVTSWHQDPEVGMTHTYLPVSVSADAMDVLALPLARKVFFAGEATCRQFPQSVAGAYISGVREAGQIMDDVTMATSQPHLLPDVAKDLTGRTNSGRCVATPPEEVKGKDAPLHGAGTVKQERDVECGMDTSTWPTSHQGTAADVCSQDKERDPAVCSQDKVKEERDPAVHSQDKERDPAVCSQDKERDPAVCSQDKVKEERDPAVHSQDKERDPAVHSQDKERDPAVHSQDKVKQERDPAVHSQDKERDPAVHSQDKERDPAVHSQDKERDPAVHSQDKEGDPAVHSQDKEGDPAVHSQDKEGDPAVCSQDKEGDPAVHSQDKEGDPAVHSQDKVKQERDPACDAASSKEEVKGKAAAPIVATWLEGVNQDQDRVPEICAAGWWKEAKHNAAVDVPATQAQGGKVCMPEVTTSVDGVHV